MSARYVSPASLMVAWDDGEVTLLRYEVKYRWYHFREKLWLWFVWHLPRKLAYWCFIRVYSCTMEAPGPEYEKVCKAWEKGR